MGLSREDVGIIHKWLKSSPRKIPEDAFAPGPWRLLAFVILDTLRREHAAGVEEGFAKGRSTFR